MRIAWVAFLLVAGCMQPPGGGPAIPQDFTATQPAMEHSDINTPYTIQVGAAAHLNATLVWGTAGNHLELHLEPMGRGYAATSPFDTVAHIESDLDPGTYTLRVAGHAMTADAWHLEAHFTRL